MTKEEAIKQLKAMLKPGESVTVKRSPKVPTVSDMKAGLLREIHPFDIRAVRTETVESARLVVEYYLDEVIAGNMTPKEAKAELLEVLV